VVEPAASKMSQHADKLIRGATSLSGDFTPNLIVEQLREMNQHVMADLVEAMNDEIERLKFLLDAQQIPNRRRRK
jgi:5-bromo-4-chloroindolyl phosphate hydrolysis protein